MAVTAPEWLTRRSGRLKLASDGRTWYVILSDNMVYAVAERPLKNGFGAYVKQANNGRHFPSDSTAASPDEAVMAGLEDLRKALGW